jgi:DNA-binding NarL/FixJ family response regulator
MVEQHPFKLLVPGSNPGQPTIRGSAVSPGADRQIPNPMKRLVIVEDQTAIREMLVEILRLDPNYQLVGEAGDGQAAVQLVLETQPDLIVLDAKLPGLNGVDILRRVAKKLPNTRVLVFSGHENPVLVRDMLEAGAHGFVEKTAGLFEFKKGLETVANGGTYFGPAVAALLRNVVANPTAVNNAPDFLTDREREILQLVAESHSTREIALKLGISVKTVDNHRTNLMRKLNLHDVASLTRYALEVGIIEQKKLV